MRKAFTGALLGLLLGSLAMVSAQPYSAQIEQAIRTLTQGTRVFTTLTFADSTSQTTAAVAGAPSAGTYILKTAVGSLPSAQSLGTLTTGLTLNTVVGSTGTLSTFVPSAACGAGTFVTALGASGTTTCGTPAITGSSKLSAFAATSSSELFGVISDETGGTGVLVGSISPIFGTDITTGAIATQDVLKLLPLTSATRFTGTITTSDLTADKSWTLPNQTGAVALVQGNGVVTLADGATPALDASLGAVFYLDAAGDRTIAVPTNAVAGQKIIIVHYANGAGRTLALNAGAGGFRFGSDITALTATASGKTDYIGCVYNGTASMWDVVAVVKGY